MRSHVARSLLLLGALGLSVSPAVGQDGPHRIGIGIGLQNTSLVTDDFAALLNVSPRIYVPVMVTPSLVLEPAIGFIRTNREDDDFSEKWSAMYLGSSLFYVFQPMDRGRIYAGPRIAFLMIRGETDFAGDESEQSRNDMIVSGVIGGEFFVVPGFSLGGEGSLDFLNVGDIEIDGDESEVDASVMGIGAEFKVRWYLR